jgi:signal transduction histidine kinase
MSQDDRSDVVANFNELGQLAAGVGHHVINAFSAIVSNAELLRLTDDSQSRIDPEAVAEVVIRTALEASAVARRLIDFSRVATATGSSRLALDRLAKEVLEAERDKATPGINWVGEIEPVPPIIGHEHQLRAMLGHLIENAYEAMPKSGGTITITTRRDERGWVSLELRDTGEGLSARSLERAIEPFFTTKPGHPGVGLSIANGIWRRHRGTLAIHSRPGEGTTIRLCVEPNRDVDSEESRPATKARAQVPVK